MLNTNGALPTQIAGGQSVGVFTNTLIPFSGAHSIGLTMQIVNTNKFAANSNLVVTIYPAYDTGGGNGSGINQAYGTNFSTTPLLTWTIKLPNQHVPKHKPAGDALGTGNVAGLHHHQRDQQQRGADAHTEASAP